MITNFFIPELNNHDVQELWFQQDGATCHTARATIDVLKDTFGDRLISRFGPVNWPPRSCDLTPLDYFCGAISYHWELKLNGATAHEDQDLLCPSQYTLAAEVHEQMFRSGVQSEARPPVFKSTSKVGTHLSTHCSRDERVS
ncbi:uncharacterized protein TNCV_3290881 [Trichonephila clavipes]|nr:uncharacterized protein TNCV_3290881 [Trichonephila clavipes]